MKNLAVNNTGRYFLCAALPLVVISCGLTSCTDKKIYTYPVRKATLQEAIMQLVTHSPNIHRFRNNMPGDSTSEEIPYYDDVTNYLAFKIETTTDTCEYTIGYYGGKEYWDTATMTPIFIRHAHDKTGNGGEYLSLHGELKKHVTDLFESEFLPQLDKIIGVPHVVEK